MSDRTPLQQEILETAKRNPDMTNQQIADTVGCSESYVSDVRREYGDKTTPSSSTSSSSSSGGVLATLFWATFILPLKITIWLCIVALKFTLLLVALPVKFLQAIFN